MPTQMIYSTSLRQINYIAAWMQNYIDNANINNEFERKLALSMQELIQELYRINVLEKGLMQNEKHRKLSLFGENIDKRENHFGDIYSVNYKGSFAQFAQAQRHRTINYQLQLLDKKEYFIPPIIEDEPALVDEWLNDMELVSKVNPQGEIVLINERGLYEYFILKCKERLCSAAQLEIMRQTRITLLEYQKALEEAHSHLAEDISKYTHGARCTFPDYNCQQDCKFKEGKTLSRKI